MSYSQSNLCWKCTKKDKCTDRHFVDGAIAGIHSVWPAEKGHLGAGTITLACQNLEEEKQKEA